MEKLVDYPNINKMTNLNKLSTIFNYPLLSYLKALKILHFKTLFFSADWNQTFHIYKQSKI